MKFYGCCDSLNGFIDLSNGFSSITFNCIQKMNTEKKVANSNGTKNGNIRSLKYCFVLAASQTRANVLHY